MVITPKLEKFRKVFADKLKEEVKCFSINRAFWAVYPAKMPFIDKKRPFTDNKLRKAASASTLELCLKATIYTEKTDSTNLKKGFEKALNLV